MHQQNSSAPPRQTKDTQKTHKDTHTKDTQREWGTKGRATDANMQQHRCTATQQQSRGHTVTDKASGILVLVFRGRPRRLQALARELGEYNPHQHNIATASSVCSHRSCVHIKRGPPCVHAQAAEPRQTTACAHGGPLLIKWITPLPLAVSCI
jgi:hypothetical protein